jgi:DNA-binding MarR family transcriptional regulator
MANQADSNQQIVAQHLMLVSGYVHRLLRNEAKKLKLRWTALMVLKDLQLLGAVSQRTLAKIEQVTAPTMTVLLRQMESRGWIRRESHHTDARVSLVAITPEGRTELRRSGHLLRQKLEEELRAVPAPVLKNLQENLGVLTATIMGKIHGEESSRKAL